MRRLSFLILVLAVNASFSQCREIRDSSVKQIVSHYTANQFDSIGVVLDEWSSSCEMNEELFRLSVLNAIHFKESLIGSLVGSNVLGYLRSFETQRLESFLPYYHSASFADGILTKELNNITTQWAASLDAEDDLANLYLNVYKTGKVTNAWRSLKRGGFPQSEVQDVFDDMVETSNKEKGSVYFTGGLYYHNASQSYAPDVSFGFVSPSYSRYSSFYLGFRLGDDPKLSVTYEGGEDGISANSIVLGYDYGRFFSKRKANYLLFGGVSHTTYLSESLP